MVINITSQVFSYANLAAFPGTGAVKTLYIAQDTDIIYYWDGSQYVATGNVSTTWGSITGTLSNQTDLQTALDGKVDENADITGATKTKITYDSKGLVTAGADLAASDLPSAIDATKIADGSVSNTEFQYLDGVTSNIQTQLDNKRIYFQLGQTGATTFSPADSTTYYWGMLSATVPTTTITSRALIIPNDITIKEISISAWVNTTVGSNETGIFSVVELNGSTLVLVATTQIDTTMTWDSANKQNTKVITGLNISVSAGNYILIKYDSPTWTTNPTNTWTTFMISAQV